ncbi:hypothetical protein RvY_07432 [Ramazzottius varieornatus]|uniref:PLD phosphodiesterase domain-containing protein n=1 Tax=Ramazzottius varieornatus TaxID=947166 RepID=A0A1D1V4Q3_RAMVA|nr:hypothetical protein RvY_07432 [Ramazzottius varieornatus]
MQRLNEAKKKRAIEPWCFPVSIMGILILLIIFLPFISTDKLDQRGRSQPCNDQECRLILSESMPRHLKYPKEAPLFPSTFRTWEDLIHMAQHSIDIASFYWDLHRGEGLVSSHRSPQHQGERIFNLLVKAGLKRKLKVRVAQSAANARFPDNDTSVLQKLGAAEVRSLNFTYLLGSGVLHTKMWIIDNRHFWVGSANMDWRSLTEVKELGLAGINCSCMAQDLAKVFSVYWYLGEEPQKPVPPHWPTAYSTHINRTNPLSLFYNNSKTPSLVYMASSPPPFSSNGRNSDIDALLNVVSGARIFVYIAVMDYTPVLQDQYGKKYWPVIDDALRASAYSRNVTVRLLVSKWNHTNPAMVYHLRSLLALNGIMRGRIEIRWFEVPAFTPEEKDIPFARVNHNKYMVTDSCAYIGTSNWEGSYFTTTAGVSVVLSEPHSAPYSGSNDSSPSTNDNTTTIRDQLESVFVRDWSSKYASSVTIPG